MNEVDLIRRCRAGDCEVFRLLIKRHSKVLFGTAYLMTRDHGLAEDVVQEALISAWRGLPSFRPGGSFRAWLIRILVNEVGKKRRRRRVQEAPLEEGIAVSGNPGETEDAVLQEEERQRLNRALRGLPKVQREAAVLRYYADLTVPEVAKALGCREGTVKSRLHRALHHLGEILEVDGWRLGLR